MNTVIFPDQKTGGRLSEVRLPNGMKTTLEYGSVAQERALAALRHWRAGAGSGEDSRDTYQWDAVRRLTQWSQASRPAGGGALVGRVGSFAYDDADQLTGAVWSEGGVATNSRSWSYDKAGNRTREQRVGGSARTWEVNEFNQLTVETGLAAVEVRGTLDRAASVTLAGVPVPVSVGAGGQREFRQTLALPAGAHELPLEVTQPPGSSGPPQTVQGRVRLTVPGEGPRGLGYDPNGNLLADGVRSYAWDAENRLVAVSGAWGRSEFSYDGLDRRVRIVEKSPAGTVTADRRLAWEGSTPVEERTAAGTLRQRWWGVGEQRVVTINNQPATLKLYYLRDHLGSIRAVADASGTIRARYSYSEWGERTKVEGDLECDFGFTGHFEHTPSGVTLAPYRGYDSQMGRWLSPDPIGEEGGINLYAYVSGNPVSYSDPLGLCERYADFIGPLNRGDWYLGEGDGMHDEMFDILFSIVPVERVIGTIGKAMKKALAKAKRRPSLPDKAWDKKAPKSREPTGRKETIDHERYNSDTGELEKSRVDYDEYGRQTSRTDYTDHKRPIEHTNPHHHNTTYGPGTGNGMTSGPIPGPAPGR